MRRTLLTALTFFSLIGSATAGTITAQGSVSALTDVTQILGPVGNANFDEGPTTGSVTLTQYTELGLTWQVGMLSQLLPGVTTLGGSTQAPQYSSGWNPTLPPPSGGGTQVGQSAYFAGVATFNSTQQSITQVGLTANDNGVQYLTAWDNQGKMLGQVTWDPSGGTSPLGFVGIDTLGVPIGMIAYGNDDLWSGQAYDPSGYTTYSDSWVWATGLCAMDIECDDQNPCTTDTCDTSQKCSHVNNAFECNDLDVCTTNDTCSGGKCVGTPTVCLAMDGCHTAGVCDMETGRCSNPVKDDGSACSDAAATCLQSQTCQGGVCTGGTPVLCPPPSSCYGAGTCDATSGTCMNPLKDGASCDDGNKCTQTDSCSAGQCVGGKPVVCAPLDSCHGVGTCNPATGVCTNPVKDGASCDDGNKCTQTDSCSAGQCAGGNPVVCLPMDSCHDAGDCDPKTGQCSNPIKRNGATCSDGNACTQGDTCMAGVCLGAGVTCTALDPCHAVGTCDPVAGCSNPVVPEDTPCPGGKCVIGHCVQDPIAAAASATATTGSGAGGAAQTGTAASTTGSSSGSTANGGSASSGVVDGVAVGSGGGNGSSSGGAGPQSTQTPAAKGGCGFTIGASGASAPWLILGLLAAVRRKRRPAQV